MSRGVDLHLHSTCSDGVLSPTALVELLATAAVDVFALTDHDTVAGQAEAAAAARRHGLTCLTGIELSARWLGRTVHVVGLAIDPAAPGVVAAIELRRDLRQARARSIALRLDRAGAPGSEALARLAALETPTRTHFARALVELGAAPDVPGAFHRWLGRGKPAHVAAEWPELAATVADIVAAGGAAVLAHPLRYMLSAGQRRTLAAAFRAAGGAALEVVTGGAAPTRSRPRSDSRCARGWRDRSAPTATTPRYHGIGRGDWLSCPRPSCRSGNDGSWRP